jgi:phosphoglycerate kinase
LLKNSNKKIILPTDVVLSDKRVVPADKIPKTFAGFDIGPETQMIYSEMIKEAKTVFWNGPMGLFEQKPFDKGTLAVAKAMSKCRGVTVVGGGDSVSAIEKAKLEKKFSHVSTGGGASLEFLEGKKLPGIVVLE